MKKKNKALQKIKAESEFGISGVFDPINKPKHYTQGKIQPLDAIQDWKLNFNLGQVIKYVARAGKKEGSTYEQDLKKAEFYLQRELFLIKNSNK